MNKILATAILFGLSTASVALAQGRGKGKFFDRLDINADGQITLGEMKTQADAFFEELDQNDDDRVTREEGKAFHERKRAEWQARRADAGAGDEAHEGLGHGRRGKHPAAFAKKMEQRAKRHFEKVDANADGTIDRSEHDQAVASRFQRMDENADGVLTKNEMRHGRGKGKRGAQQGAADGGAER